MAMIAVLAVVLATALQLHSANSVGEGLFFFETFDAEDPFTSSSWFKSTDPQYAEQAIRVTPANKPAPGFESDHGVQLTTEMRHYGFGAAFKTPLVTGKSNITIQYEVKIEEKLTCGGAYIKLPRASGETDNSLEAFNGKTPYSVMFGPDRCGSNNKIHFIVQYQNPVSLQWNEHHYNESIPIKGDTDTHLYTLAIREDNGFALFVDGVLVRNGNLLTHMVPPINPPAEVDDAEDKKPVDWVDMPDILDPNAVKPSDWDEDQPRRIRDPSAIKPDDWDETQPETIPDPEAPRPEDWDDEEDGEWEAPHINNPVCETTGCGEWALKAPTIDNALYVGKWQHPVVPNPDYKGIWAPRKVANPTHFFHASPVAHLAPMLGLVVEVWTTSGSILFDNFAISDDNNEAMKDFVLATYKLKADAEAVVRKASETEEKSRQRENMLSNGGMRETAQAYAMFAIDFLSEHPKILMTTVGCIILGFMYIILFGGQDTQLEMRLAEAAKLADAERLATRETDSANAE